MPLHLHYFTNENASISVSLTMKIANVNLFVMFNIYEDASTFVILLAFIDKETTNLIFDELKRNW